MDSGRQLVVYERIPNGAPPPPPLPPALPPPLPPPLPAPPAAPPIRQAMAAIHRKSYIDMAALLITFATFAGGLTLTSQFVITCPCSRLEALLELAAQLLLAAPFVLLSIYLLLYRSNAAVVPDDQPWERLLVVCQFIVAAVLIGTGFLVLSVALFTAHSAHSAFSVAGILFFAFIVFATILAGLITSWQHHGPLPGWRAEWPSYIAFFIVLLSELAVACVLIGLSGRNARDQPVQFGCNPIQTSSTDAPPAWSISSASVTSCQKAYGIYTSPPADNTSPTPASISTTTVYELTVFNISIPTIIVPTPVIPTPIVPTPIIPTPVITITIDEVRGTIPTTNKPLVTVNVDVDWNMECVGLSGKIDCTADVTVEIVKGGTGGGGGSGSKTASVT